LLVVQRGSGWGLDTEAWAKHELAHAAFASLELLIAKLRHLGMIAAGLTHLRNIVLISFHDCMTSNNNIHIPYHVISCQIEAETSLGAAGRDELKRVLLEGHNINEISSSGPGGGGGRINGIITPSSSPLSSSLPQSLPLVSSVSGSSMSSGGVSTPRSHHINGNNQSSNGVVPMISPSSSPMSNDSLSSPATVRASLINDQNGIGLSPQQSSSSSLIQQPVNGNHVSSSSSAAITATATASPVTIIGARPLLTPIESEYKVFVFTTTTFTGRKMTSMDACMIYMNGNGLHYYIIQ
jgi:hypothetical protein